MKKNLSLSIKRILNFSWMLLFFLASPYLCFAAAPVIVDHNCTNIWQIPESAIIQAKASLHIAYGHTSHGSQLISGMGSNSGSQLDQFMSLNGASPNLYLWNNGGSGGALDLHDDAMGGDAGYYPQWENNTRAYLGDPDQATGRGSIHSHVNVIIWSWCGQVSTRTEQSMIETYLAPMNQLEQDYPGITFVYMTGHLDGTGVSGNLHLRNKQIRAYCISNNKVLYDFADIESFDPDRNVNYNNLHANDNCDYDSDNNGSRDKNWAIDWQTAHTQNVDWWNSGAAHSQDLNGNLKGYAAWWLWAILGGWGNNVELPPDPPSNLNGLPDPINRSIHLTWTDNSDNETEFVIQRKVNEGPWDYTYDTTPADTTIYMDNNLGGGPLSIGSYSYQVVARNTNGDSKASNQAQAFISQEIPNAPSDLSSELNGFDVTLSWSDNSDNEENFILERKIDNGSFNLLATPAQDENSYSDKGIQPFHTYSYRIKAVNNYGDSSYAIETTVYIADQTLTIALKQGVNGYSGCKDTYLRSEHPTFNYGNEPYDYVMDTPKANFLVSFQLPSDIFDKKIINAKLVLYCWDVSSWEADQSFELYQVLEEWEEGTANGSFEINSATWDVRKGTEAWTTPGGTHDSEILDSLIIPASSHYPEFDITGLVQKWADMNTSNYGVLLKNNTPISTGIKASEYSEYGRPCLEITYATKVCGNFDVEGDGDIDGADLASFVSVYNETCLKDFASSFGH